LPLFQGLQAELHTHLDRLSKGERVPMIAIGYFTSGQFAAINEGRAGQKLHALEQNEIVFIGRHLHQSRTRDGYLITDIVAQIVSALSASSVARVERDASYIQNPTARADGYGNMVFDRAVFEMTAKKPRAELYSVIPKGDKLKPNKKAASDGGLL
jgi:metal-dependent amidase/aminoacylase/carboxypeptidase family protein